MRIRRRRSRGRRATCLVLDPGLEHRQSDADRGDGDGSTIDLACNPGVSCPQTTGSAAAGCDADLYGEHTVTQAEIDSNGGGDGDLDNTVTADSTQTEPVSDSARCRSPSARRWRSRRRSTEVDVEHDAAVPVVGGRRDLVLDPGLEHGQSDVDRGVGATGSQYRLLRRGRQPDDRRSRWPGRVADLYG